MPCLPLPSLSRWSRAWRALGAALACAGALAAAQAATLELEGPRGRQQLDGAALAAHAQARDIDVPQDVAYQRAMRYRAVPLAVVLRELGLAPQDTLEVAATDGFVAQLPGALALQQGAGQAQPWLAIELPGAPWPPLPGKAQGAGPFYIVWPVATGVGSEQWPYAIARLAVREAPERRWPQIAVAPRLSAQDPARRGQAVFITQCLTCHTMNGAGGATLGPDLNRPMNPVDYLQPQALRRLIRNPASVRHWPAQTMPAFGPEQLDDAALDDLIAYLGHMARERRGAR